MLFWCSAFILGFVAGIVATLGAAAYLALGDEYDRLKPVQPPQGQ